MKKLLLLAIVTMMMVTCLTACNSVAVQTELSAVWNATDHNREVFTYKVTRTDIDGEGELVISAQRLWQKDISIGTENYSQVTADLVETSLTFGTTSISEKVLFGQANSSQRLSPYASYRETTIDGVTTTQTVIYSKDGTCRLLTDGEEKTSFKLSVPYYDNAQLYMILRSAPKGSSFVPSVPIVSELAAVQLTVAVSSTTRDFTVPFRGDAISCYSASINRNESLRGTPIYAHYADIGLAVDGKNVTSALVRVEEGVTVYDLKSIAVSKVE